MRDSSGTLSTKLSSCELSQSLGTAEHGPRLRREGVELEPPENFPSLILLGLHVTCSMPGGQATSTSADCTIAALASLSAAIAALTSSPYMALSQTNVNWTVFGHHSARILRGKGGGGGGTMSCSRRGATVDGEEPAAGGGPGAFFGMATRLVIGTMGACVGKSEGCSATLVCRPFSTFASSAA